MARLQTELAKVPVEIRRYGATILHDLPKILTNFLMVPSVSVGTQSSPGSCGKARKLPVETNELWSHSFKEDVPQSSSGLAQLLSQSFLDLFCGDAGVSKKICGSGFGVVSVDTCIDSSLDLCIAA